MLSELKSLWKRYNPFDLEEVIDKASSRFEAVEKRLEELHQAINIDIAELEYENALKELILQQIMDVVPDLVWFKDLDGKYIYANKAIRERLLLCDNPNGKTDAELASRSKEIYGEASFTFGEFPCMDSDQLTLENNGPSRFIEHGLVKGELLYLEVFKNIMRDDQGNPIGTCGVGRDITEYMKVINHMKAHCSTLCDMHDIVSVFDKYTYEVQNGK